MHAYDLYHKGETVCLGYHGTWYAHRGLTYHMDTNLTNFKANWFFFVMWWGVEVYPSGFCSYFKIVVFLFNYFSQVGFSHSVFLIYALRIFVCSTRNVVHTSRDHFLVLRNVFCGGSSSSNSRISDYFKITFASPSRSRKVICCNFSDPCGTSVWSLFAKSSAVNEQCTTRMDDVGGY